MDKSLQFEVNGVPVRLWGGNWVIPHATTAVRWKNFTMPGEVKRIRILGARRKGRICAKGFYSTARSVLDYNPAG